MLTNQRVDEIFKEMEGYTLELARDPAMLGPQYFQDLIATCRSYLNKVSLITSELNREKLEVSSDLRRLEALYALDYDNLMANDGRVKGLANVEDRKATAGFLLRTQKEEINALKGRQHSLDGVGKVVALRTRELQATMGAIRDQRRLMQTELSTGAFYGDERPLKGQRREANGGIGVEDINAADLEALMIDPAPDPETPEVSTPAEPDPPKPAVAAEVAVSTNAPVLVETPASRRSDPAEVAMLEFLDASAVTAPQAVVEEPNHKVSPPAEPKSEVDEFLSMLDGI